MVKLARPGNPVEIEQQKAEALTKAMLEAAKRLGLSPQDTAAIIGVQGGALAAMKKGERVVDGVNGEAENADAVVRVVKRLQTLLGPDESKWRAWLRREVSGLGDKPLAILLQRQGVLKVAAFLERADEL